MVAEQRVEAQAIGLLYEPDLPYGRRVQPGWRRNDLGNLVRDHRDDAFGAAVQIALARYLIGGQPRAEVAAGLGMAERRFHDHLRGHTWPTYTQPVLRALRRLGAPSRRWRADGCQRHHTATVLDAVGAFLIESLPAMEGRIEPHPYLLADLRLLTVGLEARR